MPGVVGEVTYMAPADPGVVTTDGRAISVFGTVLPNSPPGEFQVLAVYRLVRDARGAGLWMIVCRVGDTAVWWAYGTTESDTVCGAAHAWLWTRWMCMPNTATTGPEAPLLAMVETCRGIVVLRWPTVTTLLPVPGLAVSSLSVVHAITAYHTFCYLAHRRIEADPTAPVRELPLHLQTAEQLVSKPALTVDDIVHVRLSAVKLTAGSSTTTLPPPPPENWLDAAGAAMETDLAAV